MQRSSRPIPVLASLFVVAAAVATLSGCMQSPSSTGSVCPPDSTLTYASFGRPFFQTYCNGCHNGRARPLLTTQDNIQAYADSIDGVAAAGPDAVNTKMPQDQAVPLAERQKLGEWLACGAP